MTPQEAKQFSINGLWFATGGLLIGTLVSFDQGITPILIWGYCIWALYHGVQIVQPFVESLYDFGHVHIATQSISGLFWHSILLRLIKLALISIAGYMIGVLGGAFIRQLYLLNKVYNWI